MNLHNALLAMFAHDLYTDLVLTQSPCSREDYCLRVASGLLEDVSSALYLSTFTKEQMNEMEKDLQTLFTELKVTLKQQFQDAEWLDDSSRSNLTSKLEQLTAVADGGIVFLGEPDILDQQLQAVDMNTSNSYIQNAVKLIRRYRRGMHSLYHAEPNATGTM
jgi:predicted metalloendopeptidase